MNKPETLRAALIAVLPELAREPDRLRLWIEEGSAQCRQTGSLAFGFSYRLNVLLVETGTDLALIALPIFRWLQINEPHLLTPGNDGFTFDVDMLDNGTADVLIRLNLREDVTVAAQAHGGFALDYLPEPARLFDDDFAPGDLPEIPLLTEVVTASRP